MDGIKKAAKRILDFVIVLYFIFGLSNQLKNISNFGWN